MGRPASTVQEWILQNQEELIHCPYQLGNLKITKSSCRKQRQRSSQWAYIGAPENYVLFFFEKHLEVCRRCDQMDLGAFGFKNDSGPEANRGRRRSRPPKIHFGRRGPQRVNSNKTGVSP